jgi:hypothetical protein
MPDPFSTTIHVVDKQYVPGSEAGEFLSIELSPDGFSFCALDSHHATYRMLMAGTWTASMPYGKQISEFTSLLVREFPFLTGKWEQIRIACFSPGLTLIPESLYKEEYMAELAGFCQARDDAPVFMDYLQTLKGYGLYVLPEQLDEKLQALFPGHKRMHSGSILIESILTKMTQGNLQVDVFLHFRATYLELLLFDKRQVIYYQTFSFQTTEDLMYYLFYVMQQFKLDQLTAKVVCAGNADADSLLFRYLSSFFRHISFAGVCEEYKYSEDFGDIPLHPFYNLLHINSCG